MKDVAFGQYYPVDSFVHRLDPRLKILFLVAYITCIFLANSFWGLGACALVLLIAILFSRVPLLRVLRAVRGVIFLIAFSAAINIFFYAGETVYVEWGIICISLEGILFSVFLILRLVLLVTFSSLLTYTTTPVALTDGVESLLTPLKWVHFPVHYLALIMSIALRFIPILMDETERIKNAQMARGSDFETGGLIRRIKAFVPVLVPLLISSFYRAIDLADAMDSRCFTSGKRKRIKYKKLTFSWRDLIAFVFCAGLVTGVVLLRVYVGGVI